MTVTIHLPSETEHQLRAAAARRGFTLEDFLTQLVVSSAAGEVAPTSDKSAEDWVAEFRAWAASHTPVRHFVDDSRESIYEGRGE